MLYCVINNIHQEKQLEDLKVLHNEVKGNENNFKDLIVEFVKDIRNNQPKLLVKPYINQIFISANQIVYSFKKFKAANQEPFFDIDKSGNIIEINVEKELAKEEQAMLLPFFINAKAFLDLIKRYTQYQKLGFDESLVKDIKVVRDCLAHFYNKKLGEREYFVTLSIERGLRDYPVLYASDIDSGQSIYEICFSLDVFYFSLKDIFEKLKNNPSLFKT